MNYRYEIKNDSVAEFKNNHYNGNWSFQVLKKDMPPSLFSFMGVDDSFHRIREWALQNYPELFL